MSGATKAGQRSEKRNRVLLSAKLRTSLGEIDARLRDLSQKGALVELDERLEVGEEVVFTRGATIVPARIAWTGGKRVGLEFLRMIDESEVLVQLGRGPASTTQQRFRRPALHGSLSEQERKLARLWGASVGINFSGD
jgi:hypothetical protein